PGLSLVLQWHHVMVLRMGEGTETRRMSELTEADLGLTGPHEADGRAIELMGAVAGAGWEWLVDVGEFRVTGPDAAALLAEGVAELNALDGISVSVTEEVPRIRRATEDLRVSLATEEDGSGIDWLGLSVAVTVEGEPVP